MYGILSIERCSCKNDNRSKLNRIKAAQPYEKRYSSCCNEFLGDIEKDFGMSGLKGDFLKGAELSDWTRLFPITGKRCM